MGMKIALENINYRNNLQFKYVFFIFHCSVIPEILRFFVKKYIKMYDVFLIK